MVQIHAHHIFSPTGLKHRIQGDGLAAADEKIFVGEIFEEEFKNMAKKLVCGCFGTIYDAVLSKNPGIMTGNRVDRTNECINAVAEHMKFQADCNEKSPGFWQYEWQGVGRLTWESEKGKVND